MALKSSKEVKSNVHKLEITIDGETFKKANREAFNRQRKQIAVPGFRKGKAPYGMVKKYYGDGVFYSDAFEIVYPEVLEEALNEAGLELVDNPTDLDVTEISDDGVEFTVTVTVKPDVELSDYKGLEAKKPVKEITDEDVDKAIDELRERGARFVETDRDAKDGDMVTIDFEGFVDGVPFDGGKAEGFELTLGSGMFIPGFEDQVIGHKAGEEFDVNVKFPEDYTEDLAGKDALFKVKINAIKEKELPELDDDFAMDVSEYDTLDELKKHTREDLEKDNNQTAENEVESQLFMALADTVLSEIPEAMFERQIDDSLQEMAYQMQAQGIDLNTYMQFTGMDEQALRDSLRERAEGQVKCRLALEKIADLENLEITAEDLEKEYERLAGMYGMEMDAIKKVLTDEDIKRDIKSSKALDFVKDNAKIKEVTPEDLDKERAVEAAKAAAKEAEKEEKTAKKPAAKKTTAKKPAAKKTAAKKTEKKSEGEKAEKKPAKKTAAKKTTTTKKAAGTKTAAKKTTAKKTTAKKTADKKEESK